MFVPVGPLASPKFAPCPHHPMPPYTPCVSSNVEHLLTSSLDSAKSGVIEGHVVVVVVVSIIDHKVGFALFYIIVGYSFRFVGHVIWCGIRMRMPCYLE